MKQVPYFEILKQSALITWKNKFLWVFGLFISLGFFPSNLNWIANDGSNPAPDAVAGFIGTHMGIFIGIVIISIVLAIIFLVLRLVGIAAITKSANNISVYSQSTIKSIFLEAKVYFWQLFLVGFLVSIFLIVLMMILAVPAIYMLAIKEEVFAVVLFMAGIIILTPLIIIAYFLKKFAAFYIVLGNMRTRIALESAYILFKKNIKENLIMGCIEIAARMLISIFILFCLIIIAIIFAPFGFIAYWIFAKTGAIIVAVFAILAACLFLLGLFSWYASFIQTIWVLFFQQIVFEKKDKKVVVEKIEAKTEVPNPEIV